VQDAAAGEFVSGIEKGRRNALRLLRPTSFGEAKARLRGRSRFGEAKARASIT
jgi:hypothetical protein